MINRYKVVGRMLFAVAGVCLLTLPVHAASATTASGARRLLDLTPMLRALQTSPQASPPAGNSKTSAIALPDGDGMELTKKLCSGCHGTDVFARQRHDRAHWNQIIDNMMSKGMDASDDDLEKVATYLTAHFGEDAQPATPPAATPPPSVSNASMSHIAR
ncbi:hypothetical protein SAMN05421819_4236 [Bryocella elongata]|uniref:Cytochrome c domain-containing protein n=1 Tax=Bryocella elongata TaxID=863522 RepID=A0A1H6C3N4_9BACT|nr:cytochrome c [Bryocella elongata]SEG67548.1 hypothetical protein SAMN05421819_4236 [Bryocella elongata]